MAPVNNIVFLLSLTAFVSANSTIEPCRPPCPSPEAVYPHPQDCTKFFHCSYDIPFEKSCPVGLYFSPDLLRCDFPEEANCLADPSNPCVAPTTEATPTPSTDGVLGTNQTSTSTPTLSTTSHQTSEDPEICKPDCPTPEALLAHPQDCTKFYQCAFSVAYEKDCPAGLYFSVSRALCDYPELAHCTASETTPCDAVITVAPTQNPGETTGASQSVEKRDVSSVIATVAPMSSLNSSTSAPTVTSNITLSPSNDPTATLVPTQASNGTSPPTQATNGTVVSTASPESTTPSSAVCHPSCGDRWIFAHPWFCNKFFLCSNSVAYEMTCPEGLYFAEDLLRCEFPYVAECTASLDKPCL